MNVPLNIFIQAVAYIVGGAGLYVMLTNRITKLEARLEYVETMASRETEVLHLKLDKVIEEITHLRVALEQKQNRGNN